MKDDEIVRSGEKILEQLFNDFYEWHRLSVQKYGRGYQEHIAIRAMRKFRSEGVVIPISCDDCKYVEYSAAIQDALADKLGIPRQPYPTATCLRYGKTRRRDRYRMEPLPECTRDEGWTKNDG